MKILAYGSTYHDGSAVFLDENQLKFCIEAEKDSGARYSSPTTQLFLSSLRLAEPPDVVAVSEIFRHGQLWRLPSISDDTSLSNYFIEAAYSDETSSAKSDGEIRFAGMATRHFSSSHVRSHIMCSYGLSPFEQGRPCYALVWEGFLGGVYYVDEDVQISKIGTVLDSPGSKYALLYAIADPSTQISSNAWHHNESAGKIMALSAYGRRGDATRDQRELIEAVMSLTNFDLFF